MQNIIICSGNQKKLAEFNMILEKNPDLKVNFASIMNYTNDFEVAETASDFLGNALLKAQAGAKLTKGFCLADDSGIEINALAGKPGIYSKRFLESCPNGLADVLQELKNAKDRACRYVCCIVLVNPEGQLIFQTQNYWHCQIGYEAKGEFGFGFDPITHCHEFPELTVAELETNIKNSISHRSQALKELINFLR